jgi:hypothetical protein
VAQDVRIGIESRTVDKIGMNLISEETIVNEEIMKMIEEEMIPLKDTMILIGEETIHIEETMKMTGGEMTILEEITKKTEDSHSLMSAKELIRQKKFLRNIATTLLVRRLKSVLHQQLRLHLRPVLQTQIANGIEKIRRVKKARKIRKRKVKDYLNFVSSFLP